MVVAERLAQRLLKPLPPGTVFKRCECGRSYTIESWRELKREGLQMYPEEDRVCLDLRACAGCGSGISLRMVLAPAPELES